MNSYVISTVNVCMYWNSEEGGVCCLEHSCPFDLLGSLLPLHYLFFCGVLVRNRQNMIE